MAREKIETSLLGRFARAGRVGVSPTTLPSAMPHLWPWAIEFIDDPEEARRGSGSLYYGSKFKMALAADRAEIVAVRVDKERGVLLTLSRTGDGRVAEVPAGWVEIEPRPIGQQVAGVDMHIEAERAFRDRRKAEATQHLVHYLGLAGVTMTGDARTEIAFIVDAIVDASVAGAHVDSTEKLRKLMDANRSK